MSPNFRLFTSLSKKEQNNMRDGSRIKLNTFNGTKTSPSRCDLKEDYWKLIGIEGVVIQDPFKCCKYESSSNERSVLVKFDVCLESLGLCCHNGVENSLWIPVPDLLEVGEA